MKCNFKILTRNINTKANNLKNVLSQFGKVDFVVDCDGDIDGFKGATGAWNGHTTAWDLLFQDDLEEEYTWVIEDDVAFNERSIEQILTRFDKEEVDLVTNWLSPMKSYKRWCWWGYKFHLTDEEAWYGLNCICRISPSLIRKVKEYRQTHGGFMFHEIMLPSYAETRLSMSRACETHQPPYDGPEMVHVSDTQPFFEEANYHWWGGIWDRDGVLQDHNNIPQDKIFHPIKDETLHTLICNS